MSQLPRTLPDWPTGLSIFAVISVYEFSCAIIPWSTGEASYSSEREHSTYLMTTAAPVEKRERFAPSDKICRDKSSAGDGFVDSDQIHISGTSTQKSKSGDGSGEVAPIENFSTKNIPAGDGAEIQSKNPRRGLLPVNYKNAVGTSYAQRATFPRQILFQERRRDESHKIHFFSSQKMPQPFLDR